ncbi:hypothetical protein CASFOL_021371 [Castilleja foliolosa]|uniref:Uncharacterized protein n=1 Tax=Castilleja foliolosa TaxID=1961234 RepID=A0ABD3CXB2_9LAMI
MRTKTIGPRVGRKVWSICSNNHLGVGGLLLEISSHFWINRRRRIKLTANLGEVHCRSWRGEGIRQKGFWSNREENRRWS